MPNRKVPVKIGDRFGQVVILSEISHPIYSCQCDCGNVAGLNVLLLRRGTRSCGCLRIKARRTHGKSATPEYHAWHDFMRRCYNKNHVGYKDYGGRGITVCERWKKFENFLEDIGPRPSSLHSIDRVNVDGNYEPGNCRWATAKQQMRNQRIRNPLGKGVSHRSKNSYQAKIKVDGKTIVLGSFSNPLEAARAYDRGAVKYFGADARINGV